MKTFILEKIKGKEIFTDYAIPVANFSDNEFTLSTEKLEVVMVIRLDQGVELLTHPREENVGLEEWDEPKDIEAFVKITDIYNSDGMNATKKFSKQDLIEIEKALQTMIEEMQMNGSLPIQENTLL